MFMVFDNSELRSSNGFDSWRWTFAKFDEALLAVATAASGETAQIVEMDKESMLPRTQYDFHRRGAIYTLSSRWNYERKNGHWVEVLNEQ